MALIDLQNKLFIINKIMYHANVILLIHSLYHLHLYCSSSKPAKIIVKIFFLFKITQFTKVILRKIDNDLHNCIIKNCKSLEKIKLSSFPRKLLIFISQFILNLLCPLLYQ